MFDSFEDFGIDVSAVQIDKLEKYYELLSDANELFNLTAVSDREGVWKTHFLDSALLLASAVQEKKIFSQDEALRVMDVGTGAGFPGMVLAIFHPEWQVTLADSLGKRVSFLEKVAEELSLENVHAIHARAEELGRDEMYRGKYDLVVSRAVAELRILLELCIPLAKDDGFFVSYKGPKYRDELAAAENAMGLLCCELKDRVEFDVYGKTRELLFFSKNSPTPDKYPRRAGIPEKRPL